MIPPWPLPESHVVPTRWCLVLFISLLRPQDSSGALLEKPPQIVKDLTQKMTLKEGPLNRSVTASHTKILLTFCRWNAGRIINCETVRRQDKKNWLTSLGHVDNLFCHYFKYNYSFSQQTQIIAVSMVCNAFLPSLTGSLSVFLLFVFL